jgi:hypothetical protein
VRNHPLFQLSRSWPLFLLGMTSLTLSPIEPATAVSIVYEGTVGLNETVTGTVSSENSTALPQNWDFWTFEGIAGDVRQFTARRLDAGLDTALSIWLGTESDTDSYTSFSEPSANTPLLAFADDQLTSLIGGPFGDPTVQLTLPETGTYTIAVLSFLSDPSATPYRYTLRVPLADAGMIVGSGLVLGLGVMLKRKITGHSST